MDPYTALLIIGLAGGAVVLIVALVTRGGNWRDR